VVCGPTAAGKSAIATALALEYGAAIVSADSRQIYRGFDIGTAKPDWSELKSVEYVGIDVADPQERFSASRWAAMALDSIASLRARGVTQIIAGGTGFYVRALFDPLFAAPEMDDDRRRALEFFLSQMPLEVLRRWCSVLDPVRAHLGRYQLIRAIEIALLAGVRISDLFARAGPAPALSPTYLLVDPGAGLARRVAARVEQMIERGWLEEVRLLDSRLSDDAPAWKSSGYRVMRSVARGELELSEARERIIIETRQYAKRQRTWFRHQLGDAPVTRVDPDSPDCQAAVQRWWKETT
jgi:tRNA dimethylallyltransferase